MPGVPRPSPGDYEQEPLSKLRVTAFRDYLGCPYRFWLRHVLRLKEARDDACEAGYADFGTLIHDTLQRFGNDKDLRKLGDEAELAASLSDILDDIASADSGIRSPARSLYSGSCRSIHSCAFFL